MVRWLLKLRPRNDIITGILLAVMSLFYKSGMSQQKHYRFTNYTINSGLSEGTISSITQDHQGFMWFGTMDGLDRFDGYEFTVFGHDPFDSTSISDNSITKLFTDSRGQLWIGTLHGGLNLFDPYHNRFIHFLSHSAGAGSSNGSYIRAIAEDRNGNLWIGTFGAGIYEFTFDERKKGGLYLPDRIFHFMDRPGSHNGLENNFINCLFIGNKGRLWVASNGPHFQVTNVGNHPVHFSTPLFINLEPDITMHDQVIQYDLRHAICSRQKEPHPYLVYDMFEDGNHNIWITGNGGLYLLKANSDTLIHIQPTPGFRSIENVAESVSPGKDRDIFWLGTWGGLDIFNAKTLTLHQIRHREGDNSSLLNGVISCIYEDRSGCFWVGTNGYGISKYTPKSSLFEHPVYYSENRRFNTGNISVLSILDTKKYLLLGTYDSLWMVNKSSGMLSSVNGGFLTSNMVRADSGKIWLANTKGLVLFDPEDGRSEVFSPPALPNGKEAEQVIKIFCQSDGNAWILTAQSFCHFDVATKKFTNFVYRKVYLNQTYVPFHGDIYQDSAGNFWLGTEVGLLYFNTKEKTFQRYVNNPRDISSLSFNIVECVVPDPKQPGKYLWMGTAGGGLNRLDLEAKKFTHYTIKNGLPNNFINGILTDDKGFLWISTNNGISKFDPQNHTFHNYDIRDGLASNAFNPGAYYKNENGEFLFGGISGFNTFYPDSVVISSYQVPLVFTDFRLFNQSVRIGSKNSPLTEPVSQAHHITLPYKDNLISFQVAALDYAEPEKNQYAYMVKGLTKQWINLGHDRLITLGNLAPGHYQLEVKATNSDGVWNEEGAVMNIHIIPPWWRTWWAYLCYVVILISLVMLIRKEELARIGLRNRLQLERFESEKLKDVDHMKSRFFANVSHEFRTPLTLIIGPLKDMMQEDNLEKFKAIVPAMYRNAQRLLRLVNQLLDLSRLDSGYYKINTIRTDIVSYVRQVSSMFLNLAKRRGLGLNIQTEEILVKELHNGDGYFYFDEDVIEKVLTNLISNAIKFTTAGGTVTVSLSLAQEEQKYVALCVGDNGKGIPAEKIPFVFDRFYQVDDSSKREFEGSGIGLALVKELTELHGGKVRVESNPEKGTTFSCLFPFNKKVIAVENASPEGEPEEKKTNTGNIPAFSNIKGTAAPGPLILVIEDNADVRKYICDKLRDYYRLKEYKDGKEGLAAALEEMPDLIVSDVMMPEMDGFELCRILKTDSRTSHIPVILLTARADDSDKMQGLGTGADAYIIKPFSTTELQIRVSKLIELRKKMRAKFSEKSVVKPGEVAVSSVDRDFISRLESVTEKHIEEVDYTVEQLSREMHMSVSQLNRKLKAIINQTSSQYLTSIRMQRAKYLLMNRGGSVAEISWKSGYEDPGYFSKVFKAYYGFLPSEKNKF